MATKIRQLQRINEARPDQSQARDDAQLHSKVIAPNAPFVKSWKRDQGTADIQGIDTPHKTKIRRPASKGTRRVKRISAPAPAPKPAPAPASAGSRLRQTERGKAQDRAMMHSVIVKPSSPRVKAWLRDPGTADIKGIDTPKRRPARISRRTPRISPRSPKLSR